MQNNIIKVLLILLVSLSIFAFIQHKNINRWKEEYITAKINEKALLYKKDSLNKENRVLHLTVDELNYYNDSIINKLKDYKKKLQIKDNDIKALEYQLSIASKKDTIVFKDTIFKNNIVKVDTTLGDSWYRLNLGLQYPSTITVNPSFKSERMVFTSLHKETVNPPKKCFVSRWFQKKHKVLKVEVVENNPYIINKQEQFIQIVK